MKKKSFLFALFFFFTCSAFPQNKEVDSLIKSLKKYNDNDTVKVNKVVEIVSKLKRKNNEKALEYIEIGYTLCENLSFKKGEKELLIRDGDIHVDIGDYKTAKEKFNKALIYAKQENHKKHIAVILDFLSSICIYQGENNKALKYLEQSSKIRKEMNDSSALVLDYTKYGIVYARQKKYQKALEYYLYADKLEKNEQRKIELYYNIGLNYASLKQFDKSNKYLNKCVQLCIKYDNTNMHAYCLTYIGQNLEKIGDFEDALKYHNNSLKIFKKTKNSLGLITTNINIAYSYYQVKNYEQAEIYFKESYHLSAETGHYKQLINSSKYLSNIYVEQANFKDAYKFYKISKDTDDSLENSSLKKELLELQTIYDTEKKENEIRDLNQQNQLKEEQLEKVRYRMVAIFTSIGFLALLLTALFLFSRLKSKQKTLKLEQKLLRSQMNPHFIFNSLTAIQSLVLKQQAEMASKHLSKFSKLMRNILECSIDEYISLDKECETIEKYIDINNILNPKNEVELNLEIAKEIDTESIYIPPMLSQPFIENSIKHGKLGLNGKGKITVRFLLLSKKKFQIEIEDNGIGIKQSIINKKDDDFKHRSLAINITKERLASLHKWPSSKKHIQISDLNEHNSSGTRVIITTPFIYK